MEDILNKLGGMENILTVIKKSAAKLGRGTTRMMLELYYVLKSPSTSMADKAVIVAALGYQLLPTDLLSRKKFGLLGLVDNGITLVAAYKRLKSSVTPEIEQQVNATLDSWFGEDTTGFDNRTLDAFERGDNRWESIGKSMGIDR